MKSHDVLSNKQRLYLNSQNAHIKGLSQQRSRIVEKVDDIFNTMKIILDSKNIDQEFKDRLFNTQRITTLISRLTQYDSESTAIQEQTKQAIIIDLMNQSLRYFQSRYKEVFIKKEIKNFEQFAKDIKQFTDKQIEETKAQELLKTRKSLHPPLLYPSRDTWKAYCTYCYAYTTLGKNEDDTIKRIRHSKNCITHEEKKQLGKDETERIKIQYYKITPPKKKN